MIYNSLNVCVWSWEHQTALENMWQWYLPNWASHPDARQFVPAKLGQSSQRASSEVCVPTKCVHYASETPIELFWNSFQMNLRPMKPCAVIKGIEWLKKKCIPNSEFSLYAGTHPKAPIIIYLLHHNSPGLSIHTDIAMFPMNTVR
jgi:hypothetical protein